MTATMPPPLFDITGDEMTAPLLEDHALTPYGRHHGLGPGIWTTPLCGDTRYGQIESSGRRVWIYHACPATGTHTNHHCDRCEETW